MQALILKNDRLVPFRPLVLCRRLVAIACLAVILMLVGVLLSPSMSFATDDSAPLFSVGIDGHYRVGRWVGIRTAPDAGITSIETRDGDGVQVRYHHAESSSDWTYVIAGSEAAPLTLQRDDQVVMATRFPTAGSPSRGSAMIPLSMPWILALGDPMGIDQIGVNRLLDRDASVAVTRPESTLAIPNSVLGFDGIDVMLINAAATDLLAGLDVDQQRAIKDWITGGGEALLNLGGRGGELLEAVPWLQELLPLEEINRVTLSPSAIETYTSSQSPLQPFDGVRLPKDVGEILILGRDQRRVSTPIAVRYNVGFGSIIAVAADLEADQFVSWPERMDLITQLTGSMLQIEGRIDERTSRSTAYNDLAGQTRVILDRFAIQRAFNFSVISLALMALIAAIGPLDYFLINRLIGKPLLGWISFPIMAIGLSALLVTQSTVLPPTAKGSAAKGSAAEGSTADDPVVGDQATVRCNRIEIVDVDTLSGLGRQYSVNYLYSHAASRFDVDVTPSRQLQSLAPEIDHSFTAPFGYPGESFGGIQISIEDARLPVYDVEVNQNNQTVSSALRGLPLAPRSSKGIFSEMRFKPVLPVQAEVERRRGSELLQGDLINPLPFDLLDGKLVFRNWVYLLPTRFRAGDRIASIDKLRQKNFRWLLSRQKALESATETQAWDPTAKNTSRRIAEMLMFHETTGGSQYTNLGNDLLSHLDLSETLGDDRCVLYGSVDNSLTSIELSTGKVPSDDESTFVPAGEKLTMIRVVLPVTATARR